MHVPSLSDRRVRAVLWQAAVLAAVAGVAGWLLVNAGANLESRRIASGFGFLARAAGLPIGESLIGYEASASYGRAVLVGLLNTLLVSALGILLATLLGTAVGVARLSGHRLLAACAGGYVELMRNVPLLVHLLLWYTLLQALPPPRRAPSLLGAVVASNRGLVLPGLEPSPALLPCALALALAVLAAIGLALWASRRQRATGARPRILPASVTAAIGLPALAIALWGAPAAVSLPRLAGFNLAGGTTLSPELTALLAGLVTYFAAFIAEIVRGAVRAVPRGQWEAGRALGFTRRRILRLIVAPQALRLVVPPLTNQYLNLAKGSSLAVAIGYPDLVAVMNTVINQTGQAIEGVAIIMAAYLTISLTIAALMRWYDARVALVER